MDVPVEALLVVAGIVLIAVFILIVPHSRGRDEADSTILASSLYDP